jgi:predicted nucleotidyltransferase
MITHREISALARRIAEEFHPERVILFGSYAYGTPTADSDVDVMVVMPYRGDSAKKAAEIWMKVDPPFPIDLLVRTPQEIRKRLRLGDFFIQDIIEKGKVLYDATDRRVGRQSRGRFQKRAS